jgi:RHH-type transcriptional regulator, proline utilization regulon repressor / proline dehydrogenase / delta 1-pyrroline-5-carboxylate dehydrogenase
MRAQSASVILPSEDGRLKPLLDRRRSAGMRMNLNQLGEAILGEDEAENA